MKREDWIAHNPERTVACLMWGDVQERDEPPRDNDLVVLVAPRVEV